MVLSESEKSKDSVCTMMSLKSSINKPVAANSLQQPLLSDPFLKDDIDMYASGGYTYHERQNSLIIARHNRFSTQPDCPVTFHIGIHIYCAYNNS